jgi:hypothetical protein
MVKNTLFFAGLVMLAIGAAIIAADWAYLLGEFG